MTDLRKSIAAQAEQVAGKVLDYGCGLKPHADLFRHAATYVGADFARNPLADIHLDDQGRLPESANDFDAVVSFQVLEHVPDVSVYLSGCRRALATRGGSLLLTTHGIWEYHPGPHDLYRWTHEGLARTIEASGFTTCDVRPVCTGYRSLLQLATTKVNRHAVRPTWKNLFNFI